MVAVWRLENQGSHSCGSKNMEVLRFSLSLAVSLYVCVCVRVSLYVFVCLAVCPELEPSAQSLL